MSRGKNKFIIEDIKNFSLKQTLECGQCFRYSEEGDDSYTIIAFDRVVGMKQVGEKLYIENSSADDCLNIWMNYLDVDRNYEEIKQTISENDELMKRAVASGYGIRILNQDLWETIASFIISSNNNIPRICTCIETLAEQYGRYIENYRGRERYSFPELQTVASLEIPMLDKVKLGYRARYLIETARQLEAGTMKELEQMRDGRASTKEVLDRLSTLSGVGSKVANCIALFGMKKAEAFPVDIWMRRIMSEYYGMDFDDVKAMERYGTERFGKYAGYAQQYLFNFARKGVDIT